jgi:hypothetical protein
MLSAGAPSCQTFALALALIPRAIGGGHPHNLEFAQDTCDRHVTITGGRVSNIRTIS